MRLETAAISTTRPPSAAPSQTTPRTRFTGSRAIKFPTVVILNDTSFVNGGSAQVAVTSAIGLSQRGCRVILISAVGPPSPELSAAGVETVVLDQHEILLDPSPTRAAIRGIWNSKAARAVQHVLEIVDPSATVVHAHGWTKALSASALHEALSRGFKTVVSLHEYFTACPTGSFYDHKRQAICQLRAMSPKCIVTNCDSRSYAHKAWRVARAGIQEHVAGVPRDVRHFIAISDFSQDIILSYLPKDAIVYRVNNPIDATRIAPIEVEKNVEYAFVGRLSAEKGASLFARAAAAEGVAATFIGDGPCASEVREIYPAATVTGWLPREDVQRLMKRARALVFPSLWYESAGLVVPEAASMGIPSIVAASSAAREAIQNNVTGLMFETGSLESLRVSMRRYSDDGTVSEAGRSAFSHYWNNPQPMTHHVDALLETYHQMLTDDR